MPKKYLVCIYNDNMHEWETICRTNILKYAEKKKNDCLTAGIKTEIFEYVYSTNSN